MNKYIPQEVNNKRECLLLYLLLKNDVRYNIKKKVFLYQNKQYEVYPFFEIFAKKMPNKSSKFTLYQIWLKLKKKSWKVKNILLYK